MKRLVVLATACLVLALVTSGTAGARGTALTPAERNLQRQLNAVSKNVTALQKQVKTLKTDVNQIGQLASAVVVLSECSTVVTADALQGTWSVIDQISAATQAGKTYFLPAGTPQTPIDDKGICSSLGITRSTTIPPTVAPFGSLVNLVTGSSLLAKHVAL